MQGEAVTILLVLTSDPPELTTDTELTELTARLRGEAGPWDTEEQPDTELGALFRESGELVTWRIHE